VHLSAIRDGTTGDVSLRWVRRSRADTDSWNTAEAPLELPPEAYVVAVLSGTTPLRTIAAAEPTAVYTAAQQLADFGSLPASFDFTVSQVSPSLGPGLAARGTFNA
jgi:hypothetical protein